MMMKMLASGGMDILTDNFRKADDDNPKGYFEYENVKNIKEDSTWLNEAEGKAVKMVSRLLYYLPDSKKYKIIFMLRNLDEVIASQNKMLVRMGKPTGAVADEKLCELFSKHLAEVEAWLNTKKIMDVLYINYNDTIRDPKANAHRIKDFLSGVTELDIENVVTIVDGMLYRQRRDGP